MMSDSAAQAPCEVDCLNCFVQDVDDAGVNAALYPYSSSSVPCIVGAVVNSTHKTLSCGALPQLILFFYFANRESMRDSICNKPCRFKHGLRLRHDSARHVAAMKRRCSHLFV